MSLVKKIDDIPNKYNLLQIKQLQALSVSDIHRTSFLFGRSYTFIDPILVPIAISLLFSDIIILVSSSINKSLAIIGF